VTSFVISLVAELQIPTGGNASSQILACFWDSSLFAVHKVLAKLIARLEKNFQSASHSIFASQSPHHPMEPPVRFKRVAFVLSN
jgi:hypothetical protein